MSVLGNFKTSSRFKLVGVACGILMVSGCVDITEATSDNGVEPDYAGAREASNLPWWEVSQAWTDKRRKQFWFLPQGAQVIPYDWFLYLEEANSAELFRRDSNIEKYRYIPAPVHPFWNPDGLPIGFAKGIARNGDAWMGFTCAACHTSKINLNGNPTLIDGAPSFGDFQSLNAGLVEAMQATLSNVPKFSRFANNVLKPGESENALKARLVEQTSKLAALNTLNHAAPYGFGRLDAFGAILNRVSAEMLEAPGNKSPADAPVSYPFLWGTPQSAVVQWNGVASNAGIGPLARNIGEVVGVFGDVDVPPKCTAPASPDPAGCISFADDFTLSNGDPNVEKILTALAEGESGDFFPGFSSSVMIENIGLLEHWIKSLRAPKWPENLLGSIDQVKAAQGASLYQVNCAFCHQVVTRDEEGDHYKPEMTLISDVKTDAKMAENFLLTKNPQNQAWKSGNLKGYREQILIGDRYGTTMEERGTALTTVVIGIALYRPLLTIEGGILAYDNAEEEGDFSLLSYKARPLTGIWATAPYLHNGSVISLRDLLRLPSQRAQNFFLGSRDFDAVNVGYVSDGTVPGAYEFNTALPANSNSGHIYGTVLSGTDKANLLEYLKTL